MQGAVAIACQWRVYVHVGVLEKSLHRLYTAITPRHDAAPKAGHPGGAQRGRALLPVLLGVRVCVCVCVRVCVCALGDG